MVKRLVVVLLVLVVLTVSVYAEDEKDKKLTLDGIFPTDRVLDVGLAGNYFFSLAQAVVSLFADLTARNSEFSAR